jgi:V8-like Glu-specific endopeptidase
MPQQLRVREQDVSVSISSGRRAIPGQCPGDGFSRAKEEFHMSIQNRTLLLAACLVVVPLAASAQSKAGEGSAPASSNLGLGTGTILDVATRRRTELSTRSQCGPTWDAQQVEVYNGALGVTQGFVGRHETRVGYHVDVGCSGTLISDDLFISAGHCGYAAGHRVRFDYQNAPNGTPRATRDFTVSQVVEQENNGTWDYAIVRLNGNPGREYGHANIAALDPAVGSRLTMIGHPATRPKEIHAASLVDYSSGVGTNWFRHNIDTVGGNSGSGVLNDNGELVGVHTNAGCSTSAPFGGNSAMRMSRLVTRSPTLQALTRNKVLWRYTDNRIVLWTVDAAGNYLNSQAYGPYPGWEPVSYSNNRMLWRHTDGTISYWVLNDANVLQTYAVSGPYAGWTAVNHANDRVLWRHTDGRISLWTVDSAGNYLSHREYGPYAGWTAINYGNNHVIWQHSGGQVADWRMDDANNIVSSAGYGPYAGWSAVSYNNGELLWRSTSGMASIWSLSRAHVGLGSIAHGPFAGWTPMSGADRKLLWQHTDGRISLWRTNSDGAGIGAIEHGPYPGWTAMVTSGGVP